MKLKNEVGAGVLGNCLELYDYTLYGYFAAILARHFFPSEDPLAALLGTYGIYASGFILRPIGALLFGSIGDRFGRMRALQISILMMAIPTLCIGILPSYAQIGIAATCLLTLMRFLQGISVGGEIVGSYTYLIEHADKNNKGFIGSWSLVGCLGGNLLGTLAAGAMSLILTTEALESWGWRIPFIGGVLFAAAGYYLRKRVSETPVFTQMKSENTLAKAPVREAWNKDVGNILRAVGSMLMHTVSLQLFFVYFPVYLKTTLHLDFTAALGSNCLGLIICLFVLPLGGKLSDFMGRRFVMMTATACLTLLIYPAFMLISTGRLPLVIGAHALLAFVFALMHAPLPAYLTELFSPRTRYTSSSIAYNLCVGIFGGFSPFIATYLIAVTGSPLAPAIWLIFSGVVSLVTLAFQNETQEVLT